MWESLSRDPSGFIFFLFWVGVFITGLVAYAIKNWRKHEAAKMEYDLKLEMLNRGMSADDIERVLAAKSAANEDLAETRPYAKQKSSA